MADVDVVPTQRVMSGSLPEVLNCMLGHLQVVDVCRLSTVTQDWNKVANENRLWRHLCQRDSVTSEELTLNPLDQQEGCYYKCLYKKYTKILKKWMSGDGVTTFTRALKTPDGELFHGHCLVITSDYIFATTSENTDTKIYIFSAKTGEYLRHLSGLTDHPSAVILANNDTMLVGRAELSCEVCMWNVETGECRNSFAHPEAVAVIALHDPILVAGLRNRDADSPTVFVWNVDSGQLLHQLHCSNPDLLYIDGQHMAVYDLAADIVQLWHVTTGIPLFTWTQPGDFSKMLLHGATHSLVGLCRLRVCIWGTDTGTRRRLITAGRYEEYKDMVVQGATVVVAIRNTSSNPSRQTIAVIDLKGNGPILQSITAGPIVQITHPMLMAGVCSALVCVTSKYDDYINLWNVKKRTLVRNMAGQGDAAINQINASFKKLQVVKKEVLNHLIYVTYDFDG